MQENNSQDFGIGSIIQHSKELIALYLRKACIDSAEVSIKALRWIIFLPLAILFLPFFVTLLSIFITISLFHFSTWTLFTCSFFGLLSFVLILLLLFLFRDTLLQAIDKKIVKVALALEKKIEDNFHSTKSATPSAKALQNPKTKAL